MERKKIECKKINFSRGKKNNKIKILEDISLKVEKGGIKGIIGTSGCGKSTVLNILWGFLKPDSGSVLFDGEELKKKYNNTGVVFQKHEPFPWLTIKKNIEFGLKLKNYSKEEIDRRTSFILKRTNLEDLKDKYPYELSIGMKQKVSIGMILVTDIDFLLMDEPFSALDFQTKKKMQNFVLEIWKEFDKGIIFVTHDIDEAIIVSDSIYLMSANPGKIREELIIDLPRPRDVTNPKFFEYRNHIIKFLEKEMI